MFSLHSYSSFLRKPHRTMASRAHLLSGRISTQLLLPELNPTLRYSFCPPSPHRLYSCPAYFLLSPVLPANSHLARISSVWAVLSRTCQGFIMTSKPKHLPRTVGKHEIMELLTWIFFRETYKKRGKTEKIWDG